MKRDVLDVVRGLLLLVALIHFPLNGYGRETIRRQVDRSPHSYNLKQPDVVPVTTPKSAAAPSGAGTINQGAKEAQKKDQAAGGANKMIGTGMVAAGATMIAIGSASKPPNVGLIMKGIMTMGLGALALAQGGADGGAGEGAGNAARASSYESGGNLGTGLEPSAAEMAQANETLEANGIRFNKRTGKLETPFGEYSPEAFNSEEAAQKAGMDPKMIKAMGAAFGKAKELEAKAMAKLKKLGLDKMSAVLPGDSLGGGGGSSGGGNGGRPSFGYATQRGPASLAGSKKYLRGNVPVGISVDNIFEMVRRKYKTRDQSHLFF